MIILVDTNVLIRYADRDDPRYPVTRRAVASLRSHSTLHTTSQNLIELWNVLTRPLDRNGFGRSPSQAEELLRLTERLFPRLQEPQDLYERWKDLVIRHAVRSVQVHDARLVAAMLGNDVTRILTFNARDFLRYRSIGIEAIRPEDA